MKKNTSVYLDFLRIIAAFGVYIAHAGLPWFSDNMFFSKESGHKLVAIFFVLSGYLIAYTVEEKNRNSVQYLVDRFSRLYSVILPALLLTYILDFIGSYYNPVFYADHTDPDKQWLRLIMNIVLVGQVWNLCVLPSSNGPFWSIHYEFWYYILFWAYIYLKGSKRYFGIILICLLVGLKILLLLPVWLFGAIAYYSSRRFKINEYLAIFLFLITTILLISLNGYLDLSFHSPKFTLIDTPLFFSAYYAFDWLYGAIMAINLFSFNFITINIPTLANSVIKYLSSITFSLYLFHIPMLIFVAALVPYNKSSYLQLISMLVGIFLITAILAEITEKQRNHWKLFFREIILYFDRGKSIHNKKVNVKEWE